MSGFASATPTIGAQPVAYGNPPGPPLPQGAKPIQAKSVPFLLPFSETVATVTVDLSTLISQGQISGAQSVYIDASTLSASVTVMPQATNVAKTCPAGAQGVFPLGAPPTNQKFTFKSSAAVPVQIEFYNFIPDLAVWEAGGGDTPATTVNQGTPGTAPWPVVIEIQDTPISTGNPVPVVDENAASTNNPVTSPPTSGVHDASNMDLVGGQVYSGGTYAIGSQLPLQQDTSGRLVVSDAILESVVTGSKFAVIDANLATVLTDAQGTVAPATAPTDMFMFGGVFNGTAPVLTSGQSTALQLDTNGNLKVNVLNGTLSASVGGTVVTNPTEQTAGTEIPFSMTPYGGLSVDTETLTPTYAGDSEPGVATGATGVPVAWLRGSATKTVRIKRIILSVNGSSTGGFAFTISRFAGSTDFSGADVATTTPVQFDSTDPAPTGVMQINNAGTVTGGPTSVAPLRSVNFELSTGTNPGQIELDFTTGTKSFVLRGTSEWLVINASNQTGAAVGVGVSIDWTEV